jgi:hypothetical protein
MVKVELADVPPPGAGFVTLTVDVPTETRSAGGMDAVKCWHRIRSACCCYCEVLAAGGAAARSRIRDGYWNGAGGYDVRRGNRCLKR